MADDGTNVCSHPGIMYRNDSLNASEASLAPVKMQLSIIQDLGNSDNSNFSHLDYDFSIPPVPSMADDGTNVCSHPGIMYRNDSLKAREASLAPEKCNFALGIQSIPKETHI